MLELLLVFGVTWLILVFFYKQALTEFRLNQVEWSVTNPESLSDLLAEKAPLVLRGIPHTHVWTLADVQARAIYRSLPVFKELALSDWILTTSAMEGMHACPWNDTEAQRIAQASGISVWAAAHLHPMIRSSVWQRAWIRPQYACWAGNRGLSRTYGVCTVILPVEGTLRVTLLTERMDAYLPQPWKGCHPSMITQGDTPFVSDLHYMDVILRPGTCFLLPPHWFVSWMATEPTVFPMVCTITYHSPVSAVAERMGT